MAAVSVERSIPERFRESRETKVPNDHWQIVVVCLSHFNYNI